MMSLVFGKLVGVLLWVLRRKLRESVGIVMVVVS